MSRCEPLASDAAVSALRKQIYRDYANLTPASRAMNDRACGSLAGGVSGNLRWFTPYPLYMSHGEGSRTYDLDANAYLDCFLCNGPLLLGHRHPAIMDALEAVRGTGSLVLNPALMVECAEIVKRLVPCAERVRFLNSGSEAVLVAARIARAYTRRTKIVKFYGHYHGQDDQFLIGQRMSNQPLSAGVPSESFANTVLLPFNDLKAVRRTLDTDRDVAAVLLDPAMHSGGLWPAENGYLEALRTLTRERRVLLIFDEVITGFRVALGGAQEYFGVTPDLTILGKALAAGEKLAVVAGSEEVMRVVVPPDAGAFAGHSQRVFQSGTGNDATAAITAALTALRTYEELAREGGYERLWWMGRALALGIQRAFAQRGFACQVNAWGPMIHIYNAPGPPAFERYTRLEQTGLTLFYHALINAGVFLTIPTSGHSYLSFAHCEQDIDTILQTVWAVFDRYDFEGVLAQA